jgi:3-oxoacyl-[acyl-carrier protein] reductase
MLLEQRCAVVTGAAQGIGFAIAEIFTEHGCAVVLADINEAACVAAAARLAGSGARVKPVTVDVRDPAGIRGAIELAAQAFGPVGIMVNNAGVPEDAAILDMPEESFDRIVDVHLKGAWWGTKLAAAHMVEHGRGSIINMSSISGKIGLANQTNYAAAKAGIVGLTKSASKELGAHGIRVNAIQPGTIRTERTAGIAAQAWGAKLLDAPLRREGTAREVAGPALFLASDLSSYMTGAVLEVAGGRHA